MKIKPPKRNDDAGVARWRGPLFWDTPIPLMWKGTEHYEFLDTPNSVTFPICKACGHIIWNWPHFEEAVPEEACCDDCANDIMNER
jgi:hypothetical protein